MLLFDIDPCSDPDCEFCAHLDFLMHSEGVIKFKSGDAFKNGKLPVDTAQCDNILGFGNSHVKYSTWTPTCANAML